MENVSFIIRYHCVHAQSKFIEMDEHSKLLGMEENAQSKLVEREEKSQSKSVEMEMQMQSKMIKIQINCEDIDEIETMFNEAGCSTSKTEDE